MPGGNLLAFVRQDRALIGSVDLAIGKAVTARIFRQADVATRGSRSARRAAVWHSGNQLGTGGVFGGGITPHGNTWLQERRRCWQGCDEVWNSWFRTQEKVMSNKPTDTNIVASLDR